MKGRMKECPMMMIPLRKSRERGGETDTSFVTILSEVQMPQHALFTSLADYQTSAMPQAIMTIYQELAKEKDLILGRFDVVDGRVISGDESHSLVMGFLDLYIKDNLFEHVKNFNHNSSAFCSEYSSASFDAILEHFGCKR
jgi:hypothetical protein